MRLKHYAETGKYTPANLALVKEPVEWDYPQKGETIAGPNYTFRISAPQDARRVEICINQGPWQACRKSAGYWWYDCRDLSRGPYEAQARVYTRTWMLSMLRRFQVGG